MSRFTRDRDLGWRRYQRELEAARVTEVVVGIHQGDIADGQQIADYAAKNEYGTSKIPERSFMRSSFDENVDVISRELSGRYGQMVEGRITTRVALGLVGLKVQDLIKQKIDSSVRPANSAATIAMKGSSHTLINTGAMKNSVHYVIRPVSGNGVP